MLGRAFAAFIMGNQMNAQAKAEQSREDQRQYVRRSPAVSPASPLPVAAVSDLRDPASGVAVGGRRPPLQRDRACPLGLAWLPLEVLL